MLMPTVSSSTLLSPRPPVMGRLGGCRPSRRRAQGPAQTSAGTGVARAEQGGDRREWMERSGSGLWRAQGWTLRGGVLDVSRQKGVGVSGKTTTGSKGVEAGTMGVVVCGIAE